MRAKAFSELMNRSLLNETEVRMIRRVQLFNSKLNEYDGSIFEHLFLEEAEAQADFHPEKDMKVAELFWDMVRDMAAKELGRIDEERRLSEETAAADAGIELKRTMH